MDQKKKLVRSSKAQINYLCQYMTANPDFAAGEHRSPLGPHQVKAQWDSLKQALDKLGAPKSVDQWKLCWRDQKKKARQEEAHSRALLDTGDVKIPELSENTSLVLTAIGREMAVGVDVRPAQTALPGVRIKTDLELLKTPSRTTVCPGDTEPRDARKQSVEDPLAQTWEDSGPETDGEGGAGSRSGSCGSDCSATSGQQTPGAAKKSKIRKNHKDRIQEREEELHRLNVEEKKWLIKAAKEKYHKAVIERKISEVQYNKMKG